MSAAPPSGHTYRHPHPAVAVDLAIFTLLEGVLHVLLIQRGREPFRDQWALPGGFVRMDEDLAAAAARELLEETGVTHNYLEQIGAFGQPDRDPRERVISVAYFAITSTDHFQLQAGGDASAARWLPCERLPALAFDHAHILEQARARLADKVRRSTVALQFLPAEFTLSELQTVHEAILGETIDKRNFRKWVAGQDYLKATGRVRKGGQHRPAALYRARSGTVAAVYSRSEAEQPEESRKPQAEAEAAYKKGFRDGAMAVQRAFDSAVKSLPRAVRDD